MRWIMAGAAVGVLLAGCSQEPKARQPKAPTVLERAQESGGPERHDVPEFPPPPSPPPAPTVPPSSAAPGAGPPPAAGGLREMFPGVRADLARRVVEFDGTVPINVHDPKTPIVFLEVVVCTADTKEHEALVMTRSLPSNIHAALLAAGLEPGVPGSWKWEEKALVAIPPRGAPVTVTLQYTDEHGQQVEAPATDWVVNAANSEPFAKPGTDANDGFLFAGSTLRSHEGQQLYEADGAGTLIGLATFGSETIAWSRIFSPDSEVSEPEWIANTKLVPKFGTPVIVRIRGL